MLRRYEENPRRKRTVGLIGLLFAIYAAITPIHQSLLLSSGGTINKYLAIVIMGLIVMNFLQQGRFFRIEADLGNALMLFAVWIGLTLLWSSSRSATISSLTTVYADIILLVLCYCYPWTNGEKKFIQKLLILASVGYAFVLIYQMASGMVDRATISVGMNDTEADQNILSVNIGVAAIMAFTGAYRARKHSQKMLYYAAVVVILFGILASGSRGGLLATLLPLAYLASVYYPGQVERKIMIALAVAVVGWYILSDYSVFSDYIIDRFTSQEQLEGSSGRMAIWSDYFEILNHNPYLYVIGSGFGTATQAYASYFQTRWPPATHNDYVFLLVSSGVFGLCLMYRIIALAWKRASISHNAMGKALLISALIAGMSLNTVTRYGFWNVLMFVLIGL